MTTQTEAQTAILKTIPKGHRLLEIKFSRTGTHLVAAYGYTSTASATIGNVQRSSRQFPL